MKFFLILIFCFNTIDLKGAELQLPNLSSSVMDLANLFSSSEREDLSKIAYQIHTYNGPQIAILTVPDLQGLEIEDFSIRVAEKWQLGSKEKDDGLLVVISTKERAMRIEVGNGIEGEITDFDTAKFTRDIFPFYFRKNQFHQGIRIFMEDVAMKFNIKLDDSQTGIVRRQQSPHGQYQHGNLIIIAIIGILSLGGILFKNRPGFRGLFTGLGFSGVSLFLGAPIFLMIGIFLFGLILGLVGIGNFLTVLASSQGNSRGGYGGGFGGGYSGGGGGFSGGGSSGRW